MTEKQDRVAALVVFCIGLLIVYTVLSAECAAGGDCTFANGAWFDWLATTIWQGD